MTDKNLSQLPPVTAVLNSLAKYGVNFQMYDDVRVEPTDQRYRCRQRAAPHTAAALPAPPDPPRTRTLVLAGFPMCRFPPD